MLETFMRRPGEVLSRFQLLEHAWDYEYENRSNVVDSYVRLLRRKIDKPFGVQSIETVRGAGYRLREDGGRPEPDADPDPGHARLRRGDGAGPRRAGPVPLPAPRAELNATIDRDLHSRADEVTALVAASEQRPAGRRDVAGSSRSESFAQVLTPAGG